MPNEAYYLDITLLGKEYRVACPPEEQPALLAAVAYVDEKMHDIAEKTKSNISERIAVMAALNIAHELLAEVDPDLGLFAPGSPLAAAPLTERIARYAAAGRAIVAGETTVEEAAKEIA